MIELYDAEDDQSPTQKIPFPFTDLSTLRCLDIYNKLTVNNEEELEEDDSGNSIFIYLPEGDIWMNCGLTPPSEDIILRASDFPDQIVISSLTKDKGQGNENSR